MAPQKNMQTKYAQPHSKRLITNTCRRVLQPLALSPADNMSNQRPHAAPSPYELPPYPFADGEPVDLASAKSPSSSSSRPSIHEHELPSVQPPRFYHSTGNAERRSVKEHPPG